MEIPIEKDEKVLCGCIYIDHHQMILILSSRSTGGIIKHITKEYEYNNNLIMAGDLNYKNIEWENEFVRN